MILESLFDIIKKYPNNTAIEINDKKCTYQELYDYSFKIASKFKEVGISKGDIVSIELPRGIEYIATMMGLWMLNASFAALENIYPEERLEFIAKDCNAKLRIKESFFDDIDKYEPIKEFVYPSKDDISLLVYTSGSTGNPKGVIHTHESLYDSVFRIADGIGISNLNKIGEKILEAVPFSFVAGITIIYFTICYGLILSIAPYEAIRNPNLLRDYIYDNKTNIAYIPPKVLKIFELKGNTLHTVITGSEKVSDLYRKDFRILNSYGSSESGGGLTFFEIDKKYDNTPIGKTYGKEKIYVLDENLNEVEEGEMCLAGHFALGYLHHKEQSEKTFIPNPFKDRDGFDKLLKSGDIVRKLEDGNILYLNRKDWMIKINGQRVEPGEIEGVIRDISGIGDAVVKDFISRSGQTYLCAYYTLKGKDKVDENVIRKALEAKLPHYMIPSYFVLLDKLPLNQNGKLDRKALKEPTLKQNEYVAPSNEIEKELCKAFEDILNISQVGINDDFFYLGGDSIKVMMLINSCPKLDLSTKIIYEGRCPKNITSILEESKSSIRKDRDILNMEVPLSNSQLGIFLESMQKEGEAIYNNPTLLSFGKNTDVNKLKDAIEKVIKAHKGLCAEILYDGNNPSMRYKPLSQNEIIVNIVKMKEEEFSSYKSSLLKPFYLLKDRLFRFEIIITEDNIYLFFDIHHIIFDGYSIEVMFPEILKAYNGEDILDEEYTAFDASLDEKLEISSHYEKAKEYYLKEYGDIDEISLPEGDKKDNQISYGHERIKLNISLDILKNYCLDNSITENVILTAAFGHLLSAYTMHKKASFATVYNGRHDKRVSRTVSMFVKTLPVLCSNDNTLSVKDYLKELKEKMMLTMVNDSFSFIDLAKVSGYTSEVLFTYQGELFEFYKNNDLDIKLIPYEYNQTGEKLSIQVYPLNKELIVDVQYHSNRYSKEFIKEFIRRYENVLSNFLSKDKMNEINLLTSKEEKKIISLSYGGDLSFDKNKTFIDLFLEARNKYPHKVAVKDISSSYTYEELDKVSNKVANYLISKGVKENQFVALKLDRRKEFISSLIGVMKAGAAYIPIDPTYPVDRIEYMISDSNTKIVIDENLIKDILSSDISDKDINLSSKDNPCYMIYTSGSTGKPKGVVILHHSLVNAIMWRIDAYHLSKDSKNASHASFSFDASIDDIFPLLSVGGEIHILDESIRKDLDLIYDYFIKNNISGVTMSTQIGMSLINAHPDLKLDYMVMGGEKLLPMKKNNIKIFNGYGPTEFTVCSSYHLVKDDEKDIPIGKAVPNTYSLICDANGNLLPLGMVGELCLAGTQLSPGYYHREELNKERFIYSHYVNEKMYRTGDLARYNKDNELEYIGRIDFQVKLRGFRIELGEIENKAASFDNVLLTAAEVKNNLLVLYYTSSTNIDEKKLKEYLSSSLTDYMVPQIYMHLDEMPLTPNGKINRKALPDIVRDNKDIVLPRNEIEEKIFNILKDILKFDEFGVEDDFDYVGLTSLSAMQFVSRVAKEFDISLRTSDLNKYPNISLLGEYISSKGKEDKDYEILKEYPLNQVQMGILSEVLAHPHTTIYNIPTIIDLPDDIDVDRLIDALNKVIDSHPYLKARLISKDNNEFKILRDDDIKIDIKILNDVSDPNVLVVPFDLFNSPLLRVNIIKNKSEIRLFIDAHHIIFDGESLDILLKDISLAYEGKNINKESYSAYEYALDEIKLLSSGELDDAKKHYKSLLEGRDLDCILVADRNEKDIGKKEDNQELKIDKKEVNDFLSKNKVTINSLWIASLGFIISKYLNREDAYFTTVYNGRNETRISSSIGMFVHTLPIIVDPYKHDNLIDYIKDVGDELKDNMSHDIYSFKDIAHDYSLRADIMFVYEGSIAQDFSIDGKMIKNISSLALDELKAPILVMVMEKEDGYYIHTEYDGNKYESWSISSFINSLILAFKEFIKGIRPQDVNLISNERLKALKEYNSTEVDIVRSDLITLFKENVKKYPTHDALIFKDKKYSYEEVDKLTDKIAFYLARQGIGKGKVVSILLTRNEYMLISPLAVMKTGAAYQPLDSTYPSERLEFMINDAKASLLIAEKDLLNKIPNISLPTLFIEDIDDLKVEDTNLKGPSFDDLMILLYTSGTTGTPKGVMLGQGNLVNFVSWYRRYYDLKPGDVVAAYAGFGFDACMMDLYPAITNGAAVLIVPEEIRMNMSDLEKYFAHNHVTHSFMTTQVGRLFAEETPDSVIKHLSVGGEKLTPLKLPHTFKMHNGYGPTECTIFSTIQDVDREYMRIPIGRPLDNYKLYVVDKYLHEVPNGALGELLISGLGVGKGYLNQEEKTKEAFINNPFSNEKDYSRVYRTGDIVRRLEDGRIDFIGRNDGQVKIRGFRIELSEVELIIRSYPDIKDVTVQAFDNESGQGKFLAAYFTSDKKIDINDIKTFIKKEKPAYMVPSFMLQIDKIPLNQNQKVNKKALPKPVIESDENQYVAPNTDLEKEIAKLYGDILSIDKVSALDSFFDIGGTSLDAAKVVVYMMNHNYRVSYQDVFAHPSPRLLAEHIMNLDKENQSHDDEKMEIKEEIREALKYNSVEYVDDIKAEYNLGTVLLTGSTGFLGIHILKELLNNKIPVLALVRGGRLSALERLKGLLMYYFDSPLDEELEKYVKVISSDITDDNLEEKLSNYEFDTIINAAAVVKHFSSDDSIDKVNVDGVKNLIKIAKNRGVRLVQVSTLSVAGENVNHKFPENYLMKENQHYFGQDLSNRYVSSKFKAEAAILNAIEEGLDAKIIRVGNLMSRQSDGEFQINNVTNNFIRSLRSYKVLGQYPISMLDKKVDFSPIDETAKSIVLLARTNKKFSVFHSYNSHQVEMGDVIDALNYAGVHIEKVNDLEFSKTMKEALMDEKKSVLISSLVSYSSSDNLDHEFIQSDQSFSIKALYRLGYHWPITDTDYLLKAIESLVTLGFFDRDDM